LNKLEEKIMSKIAEFKTAMDVFNTRLTAAITDLEGDVKMLNDKITELQNSPGEISPEDQALLDNLQLVAEKTTAKLEALAALNTPDVPPA